MRIVLRDAIRGIRTASWTLRGVHFRHLGDRHRLRLRVVLPLQGERKRRVPRILDCEGDCAAAAAEGRLILLRRRRAWGTHEKQRELRRSFYFIFFLFVYLFTTCSHACLYPKTSIRSPTVAAASVGRVLRGGSAPKRENLPSPLLLFLSRFRGWVVFGRSGDLEKSSSLRPLVCILIRRRSADSSYTPFRTYRGTRRTLRAVRANPIPLWRHVTVRRVRSDARGDP